MVDLSRFPCGCRNAEALYQEAKHRSVFVVAGCEVIVTHTLRDFEGAKRFGVAVMTPGAFLRRVEEDV